MRNLASSLAWHYVGTPYIWGGDDATGFDCSGLVIEILKSLGILPRKGDWTANGLLERFEDKTVSHPYEGCLVFYGKNNYATHVEYCIDNDYCIGASGGNKSTTNIERAIEQNAFVKVRPIKSRSDIIGYVDPFMK